MNNLTRDEAASRAALVDVASYDVHLDLTREDGFDSTTTITTKLGYEIDTKKCGKVSVGAEKTFALSNTKFGGGFSRTTTDA